MKKCRNFGGIIFKKIVNWGGKKSQNLGKKIQNWGKNFKNWRKNMPKFEEKIPKSGGKISKFGEKKFGIKILKIWYKITQFFWGKIL